LTYTVQTDPELLIVNRDGLVHAILKSASRGLLPDGKEAFFRIKSRNINKGLKDADGKWLPEKWEKYISFEIPIDGVKELLRRYGNVCKIIPRTVYSNDKFKFVTGDEERIEHEIATSERGVMLGVYCILKFADNSEPIREYMPLSDIDKAMGCNTTQNNNVWNTWKDEMAKKSVIKRASKYVKMVASTMDSLTQNISIYDDYDEEILKDQRADAEPNPQLAIPLPEKHFTSADKVPPDVKPKTGEVLF